MYQPASGPHLVTVFTAPLSKTEVTDEEKSRQGPSVHTGWSNLKAVLTPKRASNAMIVEITITMLAAMRAVRKLDIPTRYNILFLM